MAIVTDYYSAMRGGTAQASRTSSRASGPEAAFRAAADRCGGPAFLAIVLVSVILVFTLSLRFADRFTAFPTTIDTAIGEDLVAFWRGGQMAQEGAAALAYDADAFRAPLNAANDGLLWLNPPHFFLVAVAIAAVPYDVARLGWIVASLGAMLMLARLVAPPPLAVIGLIVSPAIYVSLFVLQSGPIVALGLTFALLCAGRRPWLAGLALALLTMKPQYGLLAPVFLAAAGHWRAFGAAGVCTAAVTALSALAFGLEPWGAFYASLSAGTAEHATTVKGGMVTIFQTMMKLGAPAPWPSLLQISAVPAAMAAVFVVVRNWPRDAAIGMTLLLSAFVSPSLWVYDWPIVVAGLFFLARGRLPWPMPAQLAAGVLWFAPLAPFLPSGPPASMFPMLMLTMTIILLGLTIGVPRDRISKIQPLS